MWHIGFPWNRAAARNLGLGLAGGAGSAILVMALPLISRAAAIVPLASSEANLRTLLYVAVMLLFGAAGEEMLFRGYGFQILLRNFGPYATILPVGVLFAALHSTNPARLSAGPDQHGRLRHDLRLCVSAQPRSVAADRPALRLECNTSTFRS